MQMRHQCKLLFFRKLPDPWGEFDHAYRGMYVCVSSIHARRYGLAMKAETTFSPSIARTQALQSFNWFANCVPRKKIVTSKFLFLELMITLDKRLFQLGTDICSWSPFSPVNSEAHVHATWYHNRWAGMALITSSSFTRRLLSTTLAASIQCKVLSIIS